MNRKPFHFKQFSIYHDKCAMKVGTDGVLLGAWTPLNNAQHILDIGTGTGLIAIMLAQRSANKPAIEALEIDHAAYNQAIENISNCKWTGQIKAFHTSIQNFAKECLQKYDLIVSNPPFFLQGSKPTGTNRINARHAASLTYEQLVDCSKSLLKESGIFSVILPFQEGNIFVNKAEKAGLYCHQYVEVKPKIYKPVERLLLSFSSSKPSKVTKEELTIQFEKRNDYTPEYMDLTKAFYTIM